MRIARQQPVTSIQFITPCPKLQSLIRCYYISESDYRNDVKDVFYADGCIEVVFHLGLNFYRGNQKESAAKVIGQITQPLPMRANGTGRTFGIWFLPHAFSMFTKIPLNEINDKAIALDHVFDRTFIELVNSSIHENNIQEVVDATNNYLGSKLTTTHHTRDKITAHAVQYILTQKGNTDLDQLSDDCGISNRYLQQLFMEKVGFSPKFLIRIARFQQALNQLSRHEDASLTELTYRMGYYDQAHFIREFKEFTGTTPSQFQLSRHPINQYFLNL
jgi:AraC-like DNA-binding protein